MNTPMPLPGTAPMLREISRLTGWTGWYVLRLDSGDHVVEHEGTKNRRRGSQWKFPIADTAEMACAAALVQLGREAAAEPTAPAVTPVNPLPEGAFP